MNKLAINTQIFYHLAYGLIKNDRGQSDKYIIFIDHPHY